MADQTPEEGKRNLLEEIEKDLARFTARCTDLTAKRTELRRELGLDPDDKGKGKESDKSSGGDLAAEAQQQEADAKLYDQLSASGKLVDLFVRDEKTFSRLMRAKQLQGESRLFAQPGLR